MKKRGLPTGGNLLSFTYPASKTRLREKQGIPLPFKLREELISVYMQHFPLWASPNGDEANELSDSLQGGRQKWENRPPNLERAIMASQRPISLSNLYPLRLLHPSLPLASLGYPPASSFCFQCCRVSWESERKTPCSLLHIEWSSSALKSTCKHMVWLLKPLSSRSVWCPQEFNTLRMCRQQCSVISKVLL